MKQVQLSTGLIDDKVGSQTAKSVIVVSGANRAGWQMT